MILEKTLSAKALAAIEKLEAGIKEVHGQKEKAVSSAVLAALSDFCRQSDDFSEAVTDTGKCMKECLEEIMRGCGNCISDIEVYRRAVAFWMPGYTVQMQMLLVRDGDIPERAEKPKTKRLVMTLEDLL